MVDRDKRDQMASVLRAYMCEEITALQLERALTQAMADTEDPTIEFLGKSLWHYYDDSQNHQVVASEEEWGFFNRALLLLESDREVVLVKTARQWSLPQGIAAVCLGAFVVLTLYTGIGAHLVLYSIPFGLMSMGIAWWTSHRDMDREKVAAFTSPFPSFTSLLSTRREVVDFQKLRYPNELVNRRVHSQVFDAAMILLQGAMWLMFAPIPLCFQMLPECDVVAEIKTLEHST